MNTTTRTVIALCFTLFSVILALSKCHNRQVKQYQFEHTWTPALEAQMRDVFYSQAANIVTDDSSKAAYADCAVSKIKALFPNGLASMNLTEMTDSVKIAIMKIGAECSSELTKRINVWQPELVQQLKLQLYSYPETKLLPAAAKPEYVDCLAFRIKAQFPKGLSVAGKDSVKKFIEKARTGCLILVVNKYKKRRLRDTVNNK
ncbi:MAG: hypothetical protein M3O71_25460 [Bacteroidota bacterium]|nr:hypothetical protein [Bacteroidota bacterium]